MNSVNLIGRLTSDPEMRSTGGKNSVSVANYTLAVDRNSDEADFIRCVAFDKCADFAEAHLQKGMKIGVSGRLTTGSYEHKDGYTVFTTEVIVNSHTFCEKKEETGNISKKDNKGGYKSKGKK
jgi:single-strand DNA-binding protein